MNHTADTSQCKYDIEQLLATGHPIRIKPQGYSMYPLFIPGRDEAVIEPVTPDKLHRNDVVLYRRDRGILVLHRICRITKEGFYLVGDNQSEIEGPLRPDQFRGRLTEVIRNGRQFSVQNPLYRFLTSIWLFLCPVRPFFHRFCALLRRFRLQAADTDADAWLSQILLSSYSTILPLVFPDLSHMQISENFFWQEDLPHTFSIFSRLPLKIFLAGCTPFLHQKMQQRKLYIAPDLHIPFSAAFPEKLPDHAQSAASIS